VTYANREQRTQDLLALRLGPAIARRERALSRLTVRGQWVKLNTAALLRADLAGRYNSYQIGLRNGFLSFEDVADLEDREPLTPDQLQALHDAGLLGAATPDDTTQPTTQPTTTPQGVPG
jgi:phage portal protein BeeE